MSTPTRNPARLIRAILTHPRFTAFRAQVANDVARFRQHSETMRSEASVKSGKWDIDTV
jgi:hypothetical protein